MGPIPLQPPAAITAALLRPARPTRLMQACILLRGLCRTVCGSQTVSPPKQASRSAGSAAMPGRCVYAEGHTPGRPTYCPAASAVMLHLSRHLPCLSHAPAHGVPATRVCPGSNRSPNQALHMAALTEQLHAGTTCACCCAGGEPHCPQQRFNGHRNHP